MSPARPAGYRKLQWKLLENSRLMIAVVRAWFIVPDLHAPAERVETPQKIFILQSQEGVLEASFAKSDLANAARVAESIAAIEGDRSDSVELLIQRMRELAVGKRPQKQPASEVPR